MSPNVSNKINTKAPIAVHFSAFPIVEFKETEDPVGTRLDDKGGKVCLNLKEARKYAGSQFERLITAEILALYKHKQALEILEPEQLEIKGN